MDHGLKLAEKVWMTILSLEKIVIIDISKLSILTLTP